MDSIQPLEVGIVIDKGSAAADWQWWLLERLAADDRFCLKARVVADEEVKPEVLPVLLNGLLKIDATLFARTKPFETRQIQSRIFALPEVQPAAAMRDQSDAKPAHAFDVVVRLGAGQLSDEHLRLARFGEWSVRLRGGHDRALDLASLSAIRHHAESIFLEIAVRQHGCSKPQTIAVADYSPKFSAARTSVYLAEKATLLMHKSLASLAHTRAITPGEQVSNDTTALPRAPAAGDITAYSWQLTRSVGKRLSQAFHQRMRQDLDHWHLALGRGAPETFDAANATWLDRAEFNMADPFLFQHEERLYVFYESDHGGREKAAISVGLVENDRLRPLGEVLRCDYHLSYPHVFRDAGEIYMMPETQQARRLEIWRCIEFPYCWERHAVAFEGRQLADSNLVDIDGTWWLFTNLSDHYAMQDHSSELYLYETDGPDLKKIRPHPLNPVIVGSLQARNAGPIVSANARVFRPAQMHAYDTYGYGLNICEIERLSRSDYRERIVRRIRPGFYSGHIGIHHVSFAGGRFVVDLHTTRSLQWHDHQKSGKVERWAASS
ncbi:MAG: hypothetical protein R3D67_17600 [Hyphomicrobiaceae bacterium]